MTDLIERLNAGIAVCDRRLPTARTQQDIEVALVFREILVETRDEIERLGRELTEARDGFKEAMSDHADTLDRLAEAERDAARYRWIRSPQSGQAGWWHVKFNDDPAKIDAAIDAAMAAETVSEVQK
jgi:hypothetical protein